MTQHLVPDIPEPTSAELATCHWKLPFLAVIALVAGCATVTSQVTPSTVFSNLSLQPGQLRQHGVALLVPATVTGQEQGKQTLVLIFAGTVKAQVPEVRVVTLPETLGAINRAGLLRIGQAAGVRYLAQLKLASFSQGIRERFSVLGRRLFQTLYANIRLYVQRWDSEQGVIAWEAVEELHYAHDSGAERPVTYRVAVKEAARQLIARLP